MNGNHEEILRWAKSVHKRKVSNGRGRKTSDNFLKEEFFY